MIEINIAPATKSFASTMHWATIVGLVVITVSGIFYLAGVNQYIGLDATILHWEKPTTLFWQETKGIETIGCSFIRHLNHPDCICMVGIAMLALTPLASLIAALPKSNKIHKTLISILIVEFPFAVALSILLASSGY